MVLSSLEFQFVLGKKYLCHFLLDTTLVFAKNGHEEMQTQNNKEIIP